MIPNSVTLAALLRRPYLSISIETGAVRYPVAAVHHNKDSTKDLDLEAIGFINVECNQLKGMKNLPFIFGGFEYEILEQQEETAILYGVMPDSPFVSYLSARLDGKCGGGYGGWEFTINIEGVPTKVKGPWSSSSIAINGIMADHGRLERVAEIKASLGVKLTYLQAQFPNFLIVPRQRWRQSSDLWCSVSMWEIYFSKVRELTICEDCNWIIANEDAAWKISQDQVLKFLLKGHGEVEINQTCTVATVHNYVTASSCKKCS